MAKFRRYFSLKDEFARLYCNETLPKLQMEVLKRKTNMESKHAEWEKAFFLENGVEPSDKDMTSDVKKNFVLISKSRNLLKYWKINL